MLGRISIVILLAIASSVFAGSPATRPATQPTTKPAGPSKTVSHKMELMQLQVPKTWKLAQGDAHKAAFTIGTPAEGGAAQLEADKCCPCSETTDTIADGNRDGMAGQHGDQLAKVIGDEKIELSGAPARMITLEVTMTVKQPNAKKPTTTVFKRCMVFLKKDGNLFRFTFGTGGKAADTRLAEFKKVVQSVEIF